MEVNQKTRYSTIGNIIFSTLIVFFDSVACYTIRKVRSFQHSFIFSNYEYFSGRSAVSITIAVIRESSTFKWEFVKNPLWVLHFFQFISMTFQNIWENRLHSVHDWFNNQCLIKWSSSCWDMQMQMRALEGDWNLESKALRCDILLWAIVRRYMEFDVDRERQLGY